MGSKLSRDCCREDDAREGGTIHDLAAVAHEKLEQREIFRGQVEIIPTHCWHDPYMDAAELAREIGSGVMFWGAEGRDAQLAGVMGIQAVNDATLVRHAYVRPEFQGRGIGTLLLRHLETLTDRRIMIGTWADATWAIRFYEDHGYALVPQTERAALLAKYWAIPQRQADVSVVLVKQAAVEKNHQPT